MLITSGITDYIDWHFTNSVDMTNYKENEKESYNMKILDIYEKRKQDKIQNDFDEEIEKINKENPFNKIIDEAIKQIKELYKNEYNEEAEISINYPNLKTAEDKNKENSAIKKYTEKLENLNKEIEEINARIQLTDTCEEVVEILKTYKVLDSNGKINA